MATDPSFFTTPTGIAVIAAGGSFIAGLVGAGISSWTVRSTHAQRLAADEKLAERKFEFDVALANRKFLLDAKTADRKRKQDLAETVLTGFYEVEAAMRAVRSPLSSSHEAEGRQRTEGESKETARLRDTYYVYLARYEKRQTEIAELMAKRYRMTAWFGVDADKPFEKLHQAVVSVITAAQMLMEWSRDPVGFQRSDRDLWQKLEGDIGWVTPEKDIIAKQIQEAVTEMEAICRPILEEVIDA